MALSVGYQVCFRSKSMWISICPEDGSSNPASRRISVVLPAPSGPARPVTIPDRICAVIPSSAGDWPRVKVFAASVREIIISGMGVARGKGHLTTVDLPCGRALWQDCDRHALPQTLVSVLHYDPQSVHEGSAQFGGFDIFWCELGTWGDISDLTRVRLFGARIG